MVTRLLALLSAPAAVPQSNWAASARRGGRRANAASSSLRPAQAAVRRIRAAVVATKVLVAATLSSGPAPMGSTKGHIAASGAVASLVTATVTATDRRASSAK